jgi:hypothetical protein
MNGMEAGGPPTGAMGDAEAGATNTLTWARNVRMGLVEAAQAVFIKLGDGSGVVTPQQRNSSLFEKRAMFVRAYVRPDTGYAPHRLRGVLTLSFPGESDVQLTDEKVIQGASEDEKLETTFNFLVPAETVKGGARLVVGLYEPTVAEEPDPQILPRFPPAGSGDLDVKTGPMEMEVVLIPSLGPSGPLDDSPSRKTRLESYLADVYPVQKMTIRWHDPVTFKAKVSWNTAFDAMQRLRLQDQAAPGAYYHMLLAHEDAIDDYLGLGQGAGPEPEEAPNRVGITFVTEHVVDSQMDTISHEMGHNLGRNHAPGCGAEGVDDAFPYADTAVGVDGYSIPEGAFKSRKKFKDVMGYCYPTWISDYTWNGFAERVRIVSAYANHQMLARPARSLLGYWSPGTEPRWVVVPNRLVRGEVATAKRQALVTSGDGTHTTVPVKIERLRSPRGPEDRARVVTLDLPAAGTLASVEVWLDGEHFVVPASELQGR